MERERVSSSRKVKMFGLEKVVSRLVEKNFLNFRHKNCGGW